MRDKLKATAIHLAISLILALAILALLFLFWFPPPLMSLGAVQGVQLILIIDLVIGPLCTFIVFRKDKPGLFTDLVVIGVLQVSALTYGLWVVSGQRPSYMVLTYNGLEVVSTFDKQENFTKEEMTKLENIRTSTLNYEGLIPVILMLESDNSYMRGADEIQFELDYEMPYVFNMAKYQAIDTIRNVPAVSSGAFREENGCFNIPITSPHGSAEICMKEESGYIVKM